MFSKKDTAQERACPPGRELCGEGTFAMGSDVDGYQVWADFTKTTTLKVTAFARR